MACLLSRFLPSRPSPRHTFTVLTTHPNPADASVHFNASRDRGQCTLQPEIAVPRNQLRVDNISSCESREELESIFQRFDGYQESRLIAYTHEATQHIVKIGNITFDTEANASNVAELANGTLFNGLPIALSIIPDPLLGPGLEPLPTTMAAGDLKAPVRKKRKLEKSTKITCKICTDEIIGEYSNPCLRCKDAWCLDCVKTWFIRASQDSERMPARCCNIVMHHGVAGGALLPVEYELYRLRYDERTTANPLYCPVLTCSTFIPPRLIDLSKDTVNCTVCTTYICTKCKQVANAEHACSKEDTSIAKIKALNYKTCPKCGTGVMKMYGCPHVRCICGSHFCWDCERPINICYRRPCTSAREDGQYSEYDEENVSDSDDSEDDAKEAPHTAETTPETQTSRPDAMQTPQSNILSVETQNVMRRLLHDARVMFNVPRGQRRRRQLQNQTFRSDERIAGIHVAAPESVPEPVRENPTSSDNTTAVPQELPASISLPEVSRQPVTLSDQITMLGDTTVLANNTIPSDIDESDSDRGECFCPFEDCRGGRICSTDAWARRENTGIEAIPGPSDRITVPAQDDGSVPAQTFEPSAPALNRTDSVPLTTALDSQTGSTERATSAPEPSTPNLDDPEMLDWEAEDYDFGEEPIDEAFDVWGCACIFNRLTKQAVGDHWMQDLKYLDCMKCFEGIELLDLPDGDSIKARETLKKLNKTHRERLAWHCKKCGVVACGRCRVEKVKEMKAGMQRVSP